MKTSTVHIPDTRLLLLRKGSGTHNVIDHRRLAVMRAPLEHLSRRPVSMETFVDRLQTRRSA